MAKVYYHSAKPLALTALLCKPNKRLRVVLIVKS